MADGLKEQTFKRIGQSVETAFAQLDEGMSIIEHLDEATDDLERERYTSLAAMHLHHSWHSMIRVFRRIARDVDTGVPRGAGAPRALVDQMFQRTSERPGMLALQHRASVYKLSEFHRQFRNSPDSRFSRREVAELIDLLSEEIVPTVLENTRLLALANPGGSKLMAHLLPKKSATSSVSSQEVNVA